jgi:tRNA(His) guanylyltransferase
MSVITLKDRIAAYRDAYSQKIIRKIPVVININGRSFSKVTSMIQKPYSADFMNVMCATAIKVSHEIDGAIFTFGFGDDITVITRNDQSHETMPWFQNETQKVASAASSIATLEFNKAAAAVDLQLRGEPTFTANVFAVPNMQEAVNVIIAKQQLSIQSSLHFATYHELFQKYGSEAEEMLQGRTIDEKNEILTDECGIDFSSYPLPFRNGFACYRSPSLIPTNEGKIVKNKWIIDTELPIFSKEQAFVATILNTGADIFRAKRST